MYDRFNRGGNARGAPGHIKDLGSWSVPHPPAGNQAPAGSPDAVPQTIHTFNKYPPWLYPPLGAIQFYIGSPSLSFTPNTFSLPAGAGTAISPTQLVHTPSRGYKPVIKLMTIFVDNPTNTFSILWQLTSNGAPVPGWGLTSFPRTASNLSIDFAGTIRDLPVDGVLGVTITNMNAAGPWTVGSVYSGWEYVEATERRLSGATGATDFG